MEKTAVEWLAFEINRRGPKEDNPPQWLKELYKQAKEMEKQQIIDAYSESAISFMDGILNKDDCKEEAENYYKDTFSN